MKIPQIKYLKRAMEARHILFSALSAVALTVLCYFTNNLPIFTGEDLHQHLITQKICEWLGFEIETNNNDALFINVSFDKELVPAMSNDINLQKTQLGFTEITDRKKLYLFLKCLNESQNYKYVILDVRFCEEDKSEYDDSLFNLIESMDRIVIPTHDNMKLASQGLEQKSALAHYYSTIIETNFVRYEYTRDSIRYIPTKVYEDLYPQKKFQKYGWGRFSIYVSDGHLVNNSCFISFDSKRFNHMPDTYRKWKTSTIFTEEYYQLGFDFINNLLDGTNTQEETIKSIASVSEGRYIFIGDFQHDSHDTYMGLKPGCVILYRALKSLEEGKHIVSLSHQAIWFMIYFLITFLMIKRKPTFRTIPLIKDFNNNKLLCFIIDLASFSTFLFFCGSVEYVLNGSVHSLIIPVLYFSFIHLIIQYKEYKS